MKKMYEPYNRDWVDKVESFIFSISGFIGHIVVFMIFAIATLWIMKHYGDMIDAFLLKWLSV